MYKKSFYKTLNSICTRTFFFVINRIQSMYVLIVYSYINNVPYLFERNIYYFVRCICCYCNFTALKLEVNNVNKY